MGLPLPFGAETPLPLPPAAATGAGHGWMVFGPRGPVSRLGPPLPFGAETPLPLPLPALWVRVEGERSEARTWLGSPALRIRSRSPTRTSRSPASQLKGRRDACLSLPHGAPSPFAHRGWRRPERTHRRWEPRCHPHALAHSGNARDAGRWRRACRRTDRRGAHVRVSSLSAGFGVVARTIFVKTNERHRRAQPRIHNAGHSKTRLDLER